MTQRLVEPAPAKINLYLHVTGRRTDGYHLLDSLFVFAALHDRITAAPADAFTLEVEGPEAGDLPTLGEDNHILLAARVLAQHAGISTGASLRLEKNIPMAAGLGGGSADAAAALRLLDRMWSLGLGDDELAALGARIGADVPAAVRSIPQWVRGIGEILTPVDDLPTLHVALVNPRVAMPTVAVFRDYAAASEGFSAPHDGRFPRDADALLDLVSRLGNDLESHAIRRAPVIGAVLRELARMPGCALARMSGSGATCFGLFRSASDAQNAAETLAAAHGWWTWAGPLAAPRAAPKGLT